MNNDNNTNDKHEEPHMEPCCCSGSQNTDENSGACCPPSTGQSAHTKKSFPLRTIFSVAIIIAAVSVATYAMLTPDEMFTLAQETDSPETSLSDKDSCCPSISSFKSLNKQVQNKDFIFIVLSGDMKENKLDRELDTITKTIKTLEQKGVKSGSYQLANDSDDYKQVVKKFNVKTFPSVLAVGKGCGKVALVTEITEEKLMAGYKTAIKPGCNPNACGIKM